MNHGLHMASRRMSLFCILIIGATAVGRAADGGMLQPGPQHAAIAEVLACRLPQEHLMQTALDDDVARQAWENYLTSLDAQHLFFLASDIASFKKREQTLDDDLAKGDVGFAYEVFECFKERVRDRRHYLKQRLDEGLDFERVESYRWDRRDASWPRDNEEWNDLWRRLLKDKYIRCLVDRQVMEGADGAAQADSRTPEEVIVERYDRFLTAVDGRDAGSVLEQYLSAFTMAYDPHCQYMSPASADNYSVRMSLSLVGIGAVLSAEQGAVKVERTIPGGPAARDNRESKLEPGDRIIAVAQGDEGAVDVLHWPLDKIIELVRGERGTRVVLTVIPASDVTGLTTKQVDLVRDTVNLEEGAARHAIKRISGEDGKVRTLCVVTLPSFYGQTTSGADTAAAGRSSSRDVELILQGLVTNNVEGVLLDLRGNGGGALYEAVRMTGLFIPAGPTVQVRSREGIAVLTAGDRLMAYSGPLVVLVNRLTASASEIVAGALQDYGRAMIVGDSKTHGKGSVQGMHDMSDEDAQMGSIKITNALFYRISGSSTQLKGVTPDIVIPSLTDTMAIGEDYLKNPLAWSMVPPARFMPLGDMYAWVPALARQSEKRRSDDQRFKDYTNLLSRVDAINTREELPLNIDERKEMARTKKTLYELKAEFAEGIGKQAGDVVLQEGLNILADLVALRSGDQPAP